MSKQNDYFAAWVKRKNHHTAVSTERRFLIHFKVNLMPRAWKIAPGEHANAWKMCRDNDCIVLGWQKIGDYSRFESRPAIERALKHAYKHDEEISKGPRAAKSIWQFTNEIQPGDVVIATEGRAMVIGIGMIASAYLPPRSPDNPSLYELLPNARRVRWLVKDETVYIDKYFFVQDAVWPLDHEKCNRIKTSYLKKHRYLKKVLDRVFDNITDPGDIAEPATKRLLESEENHQSEHGQFNPSTVSDARERIVASIVRRRGQPAFRKRLLAAYKGRCAISGCNFEAILEAAHIVPYRGDSTNHVENGLLLRADLHTLFDLYLITINTKTMTVIVSPRLVGTEYEKYHGKPLQLPPTPACKPNQNALEQHRKKSGLSC